ncbi:hypothetical protein BASA81_004570 [Batrachochytrium salamandrivorans]|nr:hypothetical protein BASA81_004570 [Batrachochytrium salamandrivorans]
MLTPALQIQCPRAGNALHVLTLDGNDRTLGLPHNALPTSQTDRGYTTAPNSNRPGSSCRAAPSSIALVQPRTLIGNKDSLTEFNNATKHHLNSSSQPTRTDTVVGNMAADTCSSEEFTQGLGF